jgi:hemerythrin
MARQDIVWSDEFLVGSTLIDTQHKKLIGLICDTPEKSAPGDASLLSAAINYTTFHFSDEEAFMEKIGYPELETQRKEHRRLMKILRSHVKDYGNGETNFFDFKQFMFRWIRAHIMESDQKIGVFLQSHPEMRCHDK